MDCTYEKFKNINEGKQRTILDAALAEFSEKGYSKANTNTICEQAGISKGILFHYFKSKKNLYLYVLGDVTAEMMRRMVEYGPKVPMDLFDLITETSMVKMRIGLEMPQGYRIIYEAYVNTPKELEDEMDTQLKAAFSNQRQNFEQLVDANKFKPGIDKKRAIDLIFACSKGMYDQYIDWYKTMEPEEALRQIDTTRKEMLDTFELLKVALYKEEFI